MHILPYEHSLAQDILLTKKNAPMHNQGTFVTQITYMHFQGVFATYITCISFAKFTYMHTQGILATENSTHAHSGISNTYTYTNFVRNLGYPHNKVLHFMLIQVFLLPKAACKFKYIFLQTKIAFKLKRYFCKVFLYITYNIYTFL